MSSMSEEDKAAIKREIEEARRILREDGILTSNRAIMEKLNKHFPDPEPEPDPDKGPVPPKRKENPNEPPKPKKDAWWGDAIDS